MGPNLGRWLAYDEIPPTMKSAMIAVEDKRFRGHIGVDPIGMARSFKVRIQTGSWRQGGSTITQQLARNIFLTNSRTFGRKVKEGVLALALERKFSKDQILELYLNRVYFGGGAYGIDAASRTFFGHGAERLSLGEAAIIAGLVKAPSNYSPTADVEAARGRAGVVLNSMVENGFLSAGAASRVDPAAIRVQPAPKQNSVRYFTDWALPQLDTLIDETCEPIDVWTTLDVRMQSAADRGDQRQCPGGRAGRAGRARPRRRRAGDDRRPRLCRFHLQPRDPGRAPAGIGVQAVRLSGRARKRHEADRHDRRRAVRRSTAGRPRNSTRTHLGPVTLREAFSRSINTVSAKIGAQLGFGTIADMAHRFGISGQISTFPSMVLGTSDVRLIDMTRAFASVANRGVSVMPYAIRKVVTADGRLLYQHDRSEGRVLVAPWVAAGMTDLLQSAVLSGTGRAANIGRPVAGKTGTTSSNKDGWFIGFSSGITTGVWMGKDNARPVAGLQGGTAPARAFADFMRVAVANRPVEQFETEVPMPDWQLEPDEEAWGMPYEYGGGALVDENGIERRARPTRWRRCPAPGQPGAPDQTELDRIFTSPLPQREQRPPPPPPRSDDPGRSASAPARSAAAIGARPRRRRRTIRLPAP